MWRAAPFQTYQCYCIYFSLLYTPLVLFGCGVSRGPGMPGGSMPHYARDPNFVLRLEPVGESRATVDGCRV